LAGRLEFRGGVKVQKDVVMTSVSDARLHIQQALLSKNQQTDGDFGLMTLLELLTTFTYRAGCGNGFFILKVSNSVRSIYKQNPKLSSPVFKAILLPPI
jgi:hypothetical protein